MSSSNLVLFIMSFGLGALVLGVAYFFKSKESQQYKKTSELFQAEAQSLREQLQKIEIEKVQSLTQLQTEKENLLQQIQNFDLLKTNLTDSFKSLSAETLQQNNRHFLDLATQSFEKLSMQSKMDLERRQEMIENTVKPVRESLEKFDQKLADVEKARTDAYSGIREQFVNMKEAQESLKLETSRLVKALRAPQVRGRWGELQLKRVVEMAGMLDHCDFYEQLSVDVAQHTENESASRLRPDLVVKLPGQKSIVVDSKAVISSYIEAAQTEDENIKKEKLAEHARHILDRVNELSRKSYWDQFENSPEFVVLFLPGESFFSAALEANPALIEQSVDQKVIIATPTTLIALLKAVAYGWKQNALAENTRVIGDLGKELYKRIQLMTDNFSDLGKKLGQAVESYNKTIGGFESRVLVSARRFHEYKFIADEEIINEINPIEKSPRSIQASDLDNASSDAASLNNASVEIRTE